MKILNLSQEEMKAQQNGTSGEPLDAVGNRKDQRDEDLTKDRLFHRVLSMSEEASSDLVSSLPGIPASKKRVWNGSVPYWTMVLLI